MKCLAEKTIAPSPLLRESSVRVSRHHLKITIIHLNIWSCDNRTVQCEIKFNKPWSFDNISKYFFRCASISWFQVVSKSVTEWLIFFTASASTGLSDLLYVATYRRTIWGERYVCPDNIEDESHLKIESSSTRTSVIKTKKTMTILLSLFFCL